MLLLHSYHQGLSWTDTITLGVKKRFAEESDTIGVELFVEYMDTKRFLSEEYYQSIARLYAYKYGSTRFDAIISSDDNAFRFLLQRGDELFPNTPIVFCGVNNFQRKLLDGHDNITGVLEAIDFGATIEAALNVVSGIKKVLVVGDRTTSGLANYEILKTAIPKISKEVSYEFMENNTMEEVLDRVGKLKKDTVVLWLHFTHDRNGEFFSFKDSAETISSASTVPLFSSWDFHIGHGMVGGMVTSGREQGYTAAGLAARILKGEHPSSLPVVEKSPNRYMFDHREIKRFSLDISKLPPDSDIINMSPNLFVENMKLILSVIFGFAVLGIVIVFFVLNGLKRQRMEKLLVDTKDKYFGIFNDTSVVLLVEDISALVSDIQRIEREVDGNYREFFDNHHEILAELGKKIKIKNANQAALKLYGAKNTKDLAENLYNLQSEFRRREFTTFLVAILEKKKEFSVETVNKTLRGDTINVIFKVKIPESYDSFDNVLVSVDDITKRKKAELALIDSENRFRSAFNNAATGMALLSVEGRYLKVNRVLCSVLGFTEEEMLSKSWADITHPDDIEKSQNSIESLKLLKPHKPFEKRYRSKTGETIWVLFSGSLIFDNKGVPSYLISQFQDITPKKIAEAKLLQQKERYRKYFEDDLSGVFVMDRSGELIDCNHSFKKIFGVDETTFVEGINYLRFFRKNKDGRKFYTTLMQRKKLEYIELPLQKLDGTPVDVVVNAIARFEGGERLKEIQGYVMDMSQQKILEAQLLQAQKLESIGTMAGGVAHDFNNLLMGVLGNTSLLLLEKDTTHPDYMRLKNIEEYVKSGSSLTRQLLGFAKGGKYEITTCDLNAIIKQNAGMFSQTHKEIQIDLNLKASNSAVDVDQSQIDQVMYNLYVNAWQAMSDGGTVSIRTTNVELDEEFVAGYGSTAGKFIKIEVTDDGEGMDQQTLKRIFDPFFTTKEISRGIGLGLASSYGIIQNHAGIIKAESILAKGTSFFIYLPVSAKAPVENKAADQREKIVTGKEKILIVDDEEMILEVGCQMLEALGYEVEKAHNGVEAVAKFKESQGNFDLVILDMIMPQMSGGETFDKLKEIDNNVRVVLSSGYSLDQKANAILQRGCLGFLQKPFDMQSLSGKIRQVLEPSSLQSKRLAETVDENQ